MTALLNPKIDTCEGWLRLPELSDAIEEVVNGEIRNLPAPKPMDGILKPTRCPNVQVSITRIWPD